MFSHKIPKHSFISWMLVKQGLKTLKKLKKWGTISSDICALCWREHEDKEHLFFSCDYTKIPWNYLTDMASLQHTNMDLELQEIRKACKGKEYNRDAIKLTLQALIYRVWLERIARIYRHKYTTAPQVARSML